MVPESAALVISLTAVITYLNHRFLKLIPMVGVMLISLLMGLVLVGLEALHRPIGRMAMDFVNQINFPELVIEGMLGFLLFAGVLTIDVHELRRYRWQVATFAVVDVLISTCIIGVLTYLVSWAMGLGLAPIHCLLFGALISQSDTPALFNILKKVRAPKSLEMVILGESMFDCLSVVLFITLLDIARGGPVNAGQMVWLFTVKAAGGVAFGFGIGFLANVLIHTTSHHRVQALLTLGAAAGGYTLPNALGASGVLSVVVIGLLIGRRRDRLDKTSLQYIDNIWEMIDELLNACLFVLVGLEVLLLDRTCGNLNWRHFWLCGILAVPIVLLGRLGSVAPPVKLLSIWYPFSRGTIRILTWGALRGGIPIAMALSLPYDSPAWCDARDVILTMTYAVAVFSILVQGLTLDWVIRRSLRTAD